MLRKLFGPRADLVPEPRIPPGERVYAVGDVHGRADLLDRMLAQIEADGAMRGTAETTLVFLGDLVDRGPDSAAVVERVCGLSAARLRVRLLIGNHEEMFLDALDGDDKALRMFCRVGGRETAISYGMSSQDYETADYAALSMHLDAIVPRSHRAFLARGENSVVIGDYAFVHAGVRPGIALAEQKQADLRWIRTQFLDHRGAFEKLVVHGHTIVDEVEFRPNRIGIDTGAYATGRLTALGLEGADRWLLQT